MDYTGCDEAAIDTSLIHRSFTQCSERRSGHQSQSICSRVPIEIMANIFELCVNSDIKISTARFPFPYSKPLPLGAVCQFWREIAWALPQLWTGLDLNAEPITETRVQLAIEWLNRSGNLPLSIHISGDHGSERLLLPLIDAMNGSIISRCKSLYISIHSTIFSRISSISGVPNLRKLVLKNGNYDHFDSPLFNIGPNVTPTSLEISGFRWSTLEKAICWTSLTTFSAASLTVDELLDVLNAAPQLERTTQKRVLSGEQFRPDSDYQCVTHSRLNFLNIEFYCEEDREPMIFFTKATFPNLTEMVCKYSDFELPLRHLGAFLARSPSLTELEIKEALLTSEGLCFVAFCAPSITSLRLTPTRTFRQPSLIPFYGTLSVEFTYDGDQILLPSLKYLSLDIGHDFPWKILPRYQYRQFYEDGGITTDRPLLKIIDIVCNRIVGETDGGPTYSFCDEEWDAMSCKRALIDDVDVFRELMSIRGYVTLNLRVQTSEYDRTEGLVLEDLFELSVPYLMANGATLTNKDHEDVLMYKEFTELYFEYNHSFQEY